ncbi:hypothetical protein EMIT079MI2_150114 [Bacillus sp. IT-79MI2]
MLHGQYVTNDIRIPKKHTHISHHSIIKAKQKEGVFVPPSFHISVQ